MFDLSRFGVKGIKMIRGEKIEEKLKEIDKEKVIAVIYIFETKEQRDALYEMFKQASSMVGSEK
jgi:hypothetical protein